MRVGMYLGRHAGDGGGIGVYSRNLLVNLVKFLRESTEVVDFFVYGDKKILTPEVLQILKNLEVDRAVSVCAPIPTEKSTEESPKHRNKFTPLGQPKLRLHFRKLPNCFGRKSMFLLDQFFLPIMIAWDDLQMLHCTANCGLILANCRQVVTVHDLYQGWPPQECSPVPSTCKSLDSDQEEPNESLKGNERNRPSFNQRFYRYFFLKQFKILRKTITDTEAVKCEIEQRFPIEPKSIRSIPLGLDDSFTQFLAEVLNQPERIKEKAARFFRTYNLSPGYILIFASSDPRKNLYKTLQARLALSKKEGAHSTVIKFSDGESKNIVKNIMTSSREAPSQEIYHYLDWLPREELPYLFLGANVCMFSTLAEGYGLPAIEASCLGCSIVSSCLDAFKDFPTAQLFTCDPRKVEDIQRGLAEALESIANRGTSTDFMNSRLSQICQNMQQQPFRTFSQAAEETWGVLREELYTKAETP